MTIHLAILDSLPAWLAALARVAGFFLAIPGFNHALLPVRIRAALALAVGMTIVPGLPPIYLEACAQATGPGQMLILIGSELLLGLTAALGTRLIMEIVSAAGGLVDRDLGLAMTEFFNPAVEDSTTLCASFFLELFVILFLGIHGHHHLLRLVSWSFAHLGPGQLLFGQAAETTILNLGARVFRDSFCLVLPIFAVVLLTNLVLGLMSRFAQEFEVMMLSFPVRLGLGLYILAAMLPVTGKAFLTLAGDLIAWTGWLLGG